MKRVVIFAHYDLKSEIDQYVIQYLRELKNYAEKVIFVSDGFISKSEIEKISDLVSDVICERHGEYDFGSYKRGFSLLKNKYHNELSEIDEVIITNDSCYCINSFSQIFSKMENNQCDAWSLGDDFSNNNEYKFYQKQRYYLQSYFLVLRKTIFLEEFFGNFLDKIQKLSNKTDIILLYEEGLSELFTKHNKTLFAYFSAKRIGKNILEEYIAETSNIINLIKSCSHFKKDDQAIVLLGKIFDISQPNYVHSNKFYFLLKDGFPLLKRAIIDSDIKTFDEEKLTFFWEEIVKKFTTFDITIIKKHLTRIRKRYKKPAFIGAFKPRIVDKIKFRGYNRILNYKTLFQVRTTKSGKKIVKFLRIPVLYIKQTGALSGSNLLKKKTINNFADIKQSYAKNLVVFAHFDKLNFVEEYVIDYLKQLKAINSDIIFVSDTYLSKSEIQKVEPFTIKAISRKHGEYDFGSYKIGLSYAKDFIHNYENLVIANDSCYSINSFKNSFEIMNERENCDFWGITQNSENFEDHIQSYFVVFKRNVFMNTEFLKFFESVTKENNKEKVVLNYEIGLTKKLTSLGYKKDSLFSEVFRYNPTLNEDVVKGLIEYGVPLVKTSIMNRLMWQNFKANSQHAKL